ncbi:MAG: MiaB/RimO family radical SAM methylthiotransferase, partial [Candidatus Gracilibacteria bacterium]|nr:MiaB/RimO family radical SAM methylthiotransferase [Candidatus Gracilibacteria bacterium]
MKKYFIQTFGCAMNQADSEKINMIFLQSGIFRTQERSDADIIIFNTCSVRKKGEDRVHGLIKDIKKESEINGKNVIVGITGCMVRKTGINKKYLEEGIKRKKDNAKKINLLSSKEGIFNYDDMLFPVLGERLDLTIRIEEIKYLPLMLTHIFGESIGNDHKFDDYLKQNQLRENKASGIIIIQSGCDNNCSYCIVPQTRGRENSRTIEEIVEEANRIVVDGVKEITLVGQNVNSYGKEFVDKKFWNKEKGKWNEGLGKSPFRKLLEELNKIEGLDRIRFTSSNPHDMTQDILDAHFDLKKTCNYLHFALQSGSDEMLKRMIRKHGYKDFKKMVDYLRLRDPNFSISTDIIVGYSGETEKMFEETITAFDECDFDFVFTARYSVRKGTIAEKIYPDDISSEEKARRWHFLNDKMIKSIAIRNKLMLGNIEEILISGKKDGDFFGRTRNFKEVFFKDLEEKINIGNIVKVKITELDGF